MSASLAPRGSATVNSACRNTANVRMSVNDTTCRASKKPKMRIQAVQFSYSQQKTYVWKGPWHKYTKGCGGSSCGAALPGRGAAIRDEGGDLQREPLRDLGLDEQPGVSGTEPPPADARLPRPPQPNFTNYADALSGNARVTAAMRLETCNRR